MHHVFAYLNEVSWMGKLKPTPIFAVIPHGEFHTHRQLVMEHISPVVLAAL